MIRFLATIAKGALCGVVEEFEARDRLECEILESEERAQRLLDKVHRLELQIEAEREAAELYSRITHQEAERLYTERTSELCAEIDRLRRMVAS